MPAKWKPMDRRGWRELIIVWKWSRTQVQRERTLLTFFFMASIGISVPHAGCGTAERYFWVGLLRRPGWLETNERRISPREIAAADSGRARLSLNYLVTNGVPNQLTKRFQTQFLHDCGAIIPRIVGISLLLLPSARSCTISRSRSVIRLFSGVPSTALFP